VRGEPGTTCKMSYDLGADHVGSLPVEGDFLLSPRTGSSYLIDCVRRSPSIPGRVYLTCTRLGRHAVAEGDPGVWPIYWHPRKRRTH